MSDVDVDVDAVAAALAGCSTVASLWGGHLDEVATYLPGRRVPGIRVTGGVVELHVVGRWGVTVAELDDEVRGALATLLAGRQLDIHLADLDMPGPDSAGGPGAGAGTARPGPDREAERAAASPAA